MYPELHTDLQVKSDIFRRVGKIAVRQLLAYPCLSVRLSVCLSVRPH